MKAVAKIIAVAFAAVVVVSNPLTTLANGGSKKVTTEEQVSVKYQGAVNNSVSFKVEFENPTNEKFSLIIKNDNGDVVYHGQFTDAHFAKNVYIADAEAEIHPTFIIRTANNEIVRQFQVSKTVTENVVATQL